MPVRNWAGNVTFAARELLRPRTVGELQELVAATPRIRALGTGHSFNRIADTDGTLVTVAGLDVETVIDERHRTVEVGAGTRFAELAADLHAAGWALPNLGSLPHISLAGACATGTHGSGDTNRCLAAGAVGVEFVRGDGELVRLDRDDPDFGGCVLALGALGVVTRLVLEIEPAFQMRQDVWLDTPLHAVLDRFEQIMAAGYSVSLFSDWTRGEVVDSIWVKQRVGAPVADGRSWGGRPADRDVHPIRGADPAPATAQLGVAGAWHARLPHFRAGFVPSAGHEQQSEYLLAREHGPAAIAAVRELPIGPAVQVCEIRTVAADQLWLSPCHGRDTVGVHLTWVDDDALVQPAVAAVEAALARYSPRPHWGKVYGLPAGEIAPHYPRLADFAGLVARYDPAGRFGNAFLDGLLGALDQPLSGS